MNEDQLGLLIVSIAGLIIFGGLILNSWAFLIMRRITLEELGHVPEALMDRLEVTWWSLVSSFLISLVAAASIFKAVTDSSLFPPLLTLILLAAGLSVKSIPPVRWLYRYYTRRFDGDVE